MIAIFHHNSGEVLFQIEDNGRCTNAEGHAVDPRKLPGVTKTEVRTALDGSRIEFFNVDGRQVRRIERFCKCCKQSTEHWWEVVEPKALCAMGGGKAKKASA